MDEATTEITVTRGILSAVDKNSRDFWKSSWNVSTVINTLRTHFVVFGELAEVAVLEVPSQAQH